MKLSREVEGSAQSAVYHEGQWIQLECAAHVSHRILWTAQRIEINGILKLRNGVVGVQSDPVHKVLLGRHLVPLIDGLHAAQCRISLAILRIELDSPLRSRQGFGHKLGGSADAESAPGIQRRRVPRIRRRILRVESNRPLIGLETVSDVLLVEEVAAAQITQSASLEIAGVQRGRHGFSDWLKRGR
jgi:hypothetical protein